jgi:hypothetical protein
MQADPFPCPDQFRTMHPDCTTYPALSHQTVTVDSFCNGCKLVDDTDDTQRCTGAKLLVSFASKILGGQQKTRNTGYAVESRPEACVADTPRSGVQCSVQASAGGNNLLGCDDTLRIHGVPGPISIVHVHTHGHVSVHLPLREPLQRS